MFLEVQFEMFSGFYFHVVFVLCLGIKTTELRLTELLMFGLKIQFLDATNTAGDNPNFQSNNHKHSCKLYHGLFKYAQCDTY